LVIYARELAVILTLFSQQVGEGNTNEIIHGLIQFQIIVHHWHVLLNPTQSNMNCAV